jgi:hypothetical protein
MSYNEKLSRDLFMSHIFLKFTSQEDIGLNNFNGFLVESIEDRVCEASSLILTLRRFIIRE